ncbi:MAG: prepilin-type N-terminal cleavage/methylation domain-containing protein [Planctomycetota bacterium]|nr:prepilin-type N-terminal cleavage/methylation domain-containing protein [Planctomycetota bacterium]
MSRWDTQPTEGIRGTPPAGGFTLVEILAALAVLAIGLSAVVAMVLGSSRICNAAADRNSAAIVISEAVADIERLHLITTETVRPPFPAGRDKDVGLFIATADNVSGWPNVHDVNLYGGVKVGTGLDRWRLDQFVNPTNVATMIWPPSTYPRYYGGPLRPPASTTVPAADGPELRTSGTPFRVIYKLERHSDWQGNAYSPYVGVYVLTLAVYRDLSPGISPTKPEKYSNPKRAVYEQVSDPVVLFLRRH